MQGSKMKVQHASGLACQIVLLDCILKTPTPIISSIKKWKLCKDPSKTEIFRYVIAIHSSIWLNENDRIFSLEDFLQGSTVGHLRRFRQEAIFDGSHQIWKAEMLNIVQLKAESGGSKAEATENTKQQLRVC